MAILKHLLKSIRERRTGSQRRYKGVLWRLKSMSQDVWQYCYSKFANTFNGGGIFGEFKRWANLAIVNNAGVKCSSRTFGDEVTKRVIMKDVHCWKIHFAGLQSIRRSSRSTLHWLKDTGGCHRQSRVGDRIYSLRSWQVKLRAINWAADEYAVC